MISRQLAFTTYSLHLKSVNDPRRASICMVGPARNKCKAIKQFATTNYNVIFMHFWPRRRILRMLLRKQCFDWQVFKYRAVSPIIVLFPCD